MVALAAPAGIAAGRVPDTPTLELAGFAVLPADSFGPGPPSGQFDSDGRRMPRPRFPAQPVQGLSAVQAGPTPGTWWALSDNGYGTRWNSFDFRLALHLFGAVPDSREVRILRRIELRDPGGRFPWRLADENLPGRPLTGADVDPESLVVMPDGSFWIGDEIGPWLLHFAADGVLLAAPVELPADVSSTAVAPPRPAAAFSLSAASTTPATAPADDGVLRSSNHPLVLAGRATARIRASRGFESLAPLPRTDGNPTLLAMLEGTVAGDAPGVLRLAEFDPDAGRWTGRQWRYTMQDPAHSVSELAMGGGTGPGGGAGAGRRAATTRYLLIERDDLQGDAARFKQVRSIDLAAPGADGLLRGKPLVDLLRIPDPRGVASMGAEFRFPYWTPESLHLVDPHTLLVVADNNYPAPGGRSDTASDPTEWIWIRTREQAGFFTSR